MIGCCCCCNSVVRDGIRSWLRDYDRLQNFALLLIYIQIGCSLIGSLGASFNGVLLINFCISLFALVAIASSSQSLGRTYAILLFSSILIDIAWFILFSHHIWHASPTDYGSYFVFSIKLTLVMQIIGFFVRLSSSLLWIQIYRLGPSCIDTTSYHREADFDFRNSFSNPSPSAVARQTSLEPDDVLGGAIYDPAYYSSLFEDAQENKTSRLARIIGFRDRDSGSPGSQSPLLKPSMSRSFQAIDEENDQASLKQHEV
ncbi:hypothetical protein ACFE04_006357 [Oxalis oulophora]